MPKNITKAKHRFPFRQIRQIPKFLRRTWPIIALVAISLLVAFLNYEPGTMLIGWDNLSSELNPLLNLKRAIFSVWQEYQSLGLLGGMAHAADLPRVFAIYLFSLIPGVSFFFTRYLFSFLPLVIGPLGTYFFLNHRLFKTHLDSRTTQTASFLGGLFYLLNLSTMQTFFTPFETFTSFYGALPWLLYFITDYLENPKNKSLLIIFIVSFLSAPSFYVETIFVVFCLLLIPIFSEVFFSPKNKKKSFSKILKTFSSVLLPQLFWFLPVVFFVLTNGSVGLSAKINLMSSPETYFRNLQFGNLLDIALLKGFYFNFLDLAAPGKFDYLLSVWRNHLAAFPISFIGYLLFAVVLTGIYYSVTKKFFWTKSLLGILLICLFFLLGGGLLINSAIPLVGELLRSPFTKFSIPLSFTYSCFFAIGTVFILDLFTYLHSRLTYPLTLFTVIISLLVFTSPIFSGNLVSTNMRLSLPPEYTELFSYLKTQDPTTRIANFPQSSFWGWNYYSWGYRGSGFLWYGIQQPILDRAFDVWEKSSQTYFEEMSTALYSGNLIEFESVLDKYSVSWILLDKNVISPDAKTNTKNNHLENFLTSSSKFNLTKSFGDKIYLYQVNLNNKPQNFLSLSSNSDLKSNTSKPFANLTYRPNVDWVEKGDYLSTLTPLNHSAKSAVLSIPSLTSSEKLLPVRIEYQKLLDSLTLRFTLVPPIIFIDNKQINLETESTLIQIPTTTSESFIIQVDKRFFPLQVPAEIPNLTTFVPLATIFLPTTERFDVNLFDGISSNTENLTDQFAKAETVQCYSQKPNRKIEKIISNQSISLLGTDVVGCLSTPLPPTPNGSLLSLSFTYFSPTLTPGNVNISGHDYNNEEIPQSLEPRSTPRQSQFFATSTGKFQQANLILEAGDTRTLQEINYKDINLSTHPLLFATTTQISSVPGQEIKLTGEEKNIQISLPITDTPYDIRQTPNSNGLFPENLNCDQFNNGQTNKIVGSDGFLYQSKNATECDYINLHHLPHSLNYLLSFRTQFKSGLPLTVCLENHSTFRCDVHERLIKTTLSQSIIQPIANPSEHVGYTLHVFNQSVGNRITTNLLKEIILRPIPLNFIKSISIESDLADNGKAGADIPSFTSTHPAEFFYTVSIPAVDLSNNTALSLYQTKSPYWQAIQVTQEDLQLPSWLLISKILFSYPNLTQLSHNDDGLWHNSWSLQNCDPSSENCHLVITYLPQYLQFFGFIFLLTPFVVFLFHMILSKKKQ